MSALFKANQLSCIRGDRLLFKDQSIALEAGQALLITGPNGSGKTSLLKILCGLLLPDDGEIYWQDQDITRYYTLFKKAVLYIGHANGIKLDLSCMENLYYATQIAGDIANTNYESALEKIGLGGFEHELARTLSAGQRRRIALARLFITQTKLWILDELFTSIDRATIETLSEAVDQHLSDGGIAVMTSHHQLNLASHRVNRLELTA